MSGLDKKTSYALSQSVKSSKEAFQNYRALDVNTDQYCRLAGALNPESSDKAGRDELMGIFNTGYQGKTGLAAIKEYLTDMYDKSINSALDANKSDSLGGRKDSIRKCFGLNVRDPIVLTNDRIGSGVTTGSSHSQFEVPPNPGLSPAHCMVEVGSPDPKNIWGKYFPGYEANAPPLGSGVYWIWGTSDGWSGRPPNEAFSFYYNFVNTGSSLTATLAGGMDDKGYVKINDTLYDNLGIDVNLGVSIQPRQVQLKRGANLIEIRTINTGAGPTGVWLTITTNNNILVKTGCDGWKCTRFFYPQEVFQVSGYNKTLADAPVVCQSLGARVATYAELDEAQKNGANWCSTGWVSDRTNTAFYPITYDIQGGCGNGRSGVIDWIGDVYWFKTYLGQSSGYKAGVNCFGNKPEEAAANKMVGPNSFAPQTILPFNKNQWSRYSPGTSPPVVSPPLAPVTINQHCDGSGWSKQLTGPNVFNSGTDYLFDVSYIHVPAGVTAILTGKRTSIYNVAGTGQVITLKGPTSLNLCSVGSGGGFNGFNDNIATIETRASSA